MKARFIGTVTEKGGMTCKSQIAEFLKAHIGKKLIVTIEAFKSTRSVRQNRFYWGIVVKMVRELFLEQGEILHEDEVHDFLKVEIGKMYRMVNGVKIPKKSRKLSTMEWEGGVAGTEEYFQGQGRMTEKDKEWAKKNAKK